LISALKLTMNSWTMHNVVWYLFCYRRFGTKIGPILKVSLDSLSLEDVTHM